MSNILDALRKAQDEKNRTSDQSIIGREALLSNRPVRNRGNVSKRVIILAGSGVLLLGFVAWWLYGTSKTAAVRPITNMSAIAPQTSNAPTATDPASSPSHPLPADLTPQPTHSAPLQTATAYHGTENTPHLRKSKGALNDSLPTPESAAATPAAPSATVSNAPEGVKLTGIAWQDSRKMRRAVINDVLVGEGAVVAGAKVLEIRPGLVRFEKNGSVFEAVLPR